MWTAPWLRGPAQLLLGQPMAVVAAVAAITVLGLVVAAGPLCASSADTATLHAAAAKESAAYPHDQHVCRVSPKPDSPLRSG